LELSLRDNISVITGYLAWSGGDSAVFDPFEISRKLNIDFNISVTALDYMLDKGFISKADNKFRLTKQGSFLVDFSLFEIIAEWAYRAEVDAPYPWRTPQWMFLKSKYFPSRPPYGIRSMYVLDFCTDLLKFLAQKTQYTLTDYSLFRDFVMRASLRPTLSFLIDESDNRVEPFLERLVRERIVKIDQKETMLLFDTSVVQIGERIGRTKRKSKEKIK
jgi:predicted transcriptional regulator